MAMIDFLKICGIFALIIWMLRRKVPLYKAMLTAALAMGLVFGITPQQIALTALQSAVHRSTVTLALALILIMFLENIMRKNGMMEAMVRSLKGMVGDSRIVMAILPALVGLLPSAGGAVFSAPMVEEVSRDTTLSAEKKSFVNYWYRHVWEYVFPLYPSIILTAEITGIPIPRLITYMAPYALSAALIGIPIAFRHEARPERIESVIGRRKETIAFVGSIYPVLLIIVAVLVLHWEIWIALISVVGLLILVFRYSPARLVSLVQEAFSLPIILMVLAVIIFKDILLITGAVETLPDFFAGIGLPPELIIIVLPFVVGLATGMSQAYVGTTFPILLGLSANGVPVQMAALAYVSGFMGVMLSPVHLCLILTVQVFQARLGQVYRMLLLPSSLQMGLAIVLYFLLR
jgi:uncharacterized protein